ncbi:hypothetical protein D3OALGA1CA_2799 [Olavius algarvensis associated proteobacterium Delta 3]|nr:hypothetical protein D3OALGA1CA_2799 [Olavius algarvensis associated proteobacterium Delta 3]CAB5164026.1 hypothetical protein D3OALGB2SA_5625 [Olavius algarvensis associated proteobacterium Delta 3]
MKEIQVKTIMIPKKDYITVTPDDSLIDVLQALENARTSDKSHAHRDALVMDASGQILGKVTMIDIFKALEPKYRKMGVQVDEVLAGGKGELTQALIVDAIDDFELWVDPEQTLCERGAALKVSEVMHAPDELEYLDEEDSLEKALHRYVMGVHQPLIVKRGDTVTGVLRFGDLFEKIREGLLSCAV